MEYDETHQKILNTGIQILRNKLPGLIAVVAFGSFGTEYERHDSDLDLAILLKEPDNSVDPVKLWNLSQEIAKAIGRDVDIINLRQASTVFSYQVLTSGNTVYCSNEMILANFENLIMSMYLRFQEERKDILKDFGKGFSHG